jgi:hypothetical protein
MCSVYNLYTYLCICRFQAMQQELSIRRVEQEEISAVRTLEKQTEQV